MNNKIAAAQLGRNCHDSVGRVLKSPRQLESGMFVVLDEKQVPFPFSPTESDWITLLPPRSTLTRISAPRYSRAYPQTDRREPSIRTGGE